MKSQFTIVIPTFNGEETIGKLLEGISAFNDNYSKETIIIDSTSTDNTLNIVNAFKDKLAPLKIVIIKKSEFDHGLTRNFGVQQSKGKYVCFFSQDAKPVSKKMLDYYWEDFKNDKKVMAVYGKHISYSDTPVIQRIESDCFWEKLDPYLDERGVLVKNLAHPFILFNEDSKYLWYELSDTSSCYSREFLLEYPFSKTKYGEDMLMGKLIIDKGLYIVYDTRCSVYHSHSYSLRDYYKREKESVGLVVNEMRLKKRINFLCKVEKIMQLKTSYFKKIYHLGELLVFYFIKMLILFVL